MPSRGDGRGQLGLGGHRRGLEVLPCGPEGSTSGAAGHWAVEEEVRGAVAGGQEGGQERAAERGTIGPGEGGG